ncbi:MAG TPA: ABC transporter family substrate-binding protein [Nocardioidaceae bacterium]|nr:ABC transporter family substrate-binding protein [Nocardioidaceae bacterium]
MAVTVASLMVVTACTGGGGDGGGERSGGSISDGTIVFGADQEPAILNPWLSEGNLQATHTLSLAMLYPLWRVTPDFEYEPLLLDGVPKVSRDPFTVTYKLKEEAAWSDGTPITAQDILFTLQVCRNPDFNIAVREGCSKVDMQRSRIVDDKTFRMVFTQPYAPWKSLFSTAPGSILPAHVLKGKDFNEVWDDEITVFSGPYKLQEWNRGQQLTLVKNENYWGEPKPTIDRIVVRFIEESTSQVQALRGGEIDVLASQAQLDLVQQVQEIEGVTSEAVAGAVWEFFEYNWAVEGLGEDYDFVRKAIAQGIDREALVNELISPMNPDATVMQNLIYLPTQPAYEPYFDRWQYDPDAAEELLRSNGCTRGNDDVYTCDGVRLSFRWGFTAGNELRELQFVIVQEQLSQIGIELKPQAQEAATYFGDTWPAGEQGAWDLFSQAWLNSPDPNPTTEFWECDGSYNYRSYCNEKVTDLIRQSRVEIDPQRRAALLNRANELMAQDLPALPLYQKPVFLAWDSDLQGPEPNPSPWGHLWNVESWEPAG